MSSNGNTDTNKYGFYPKLDLEKLSIILTIENANMLRINPELLAAGKSPEEEQPNDVEGPSRYPINQV